MDKDHKDHSDLIGGTILTIGIGCLIVGVLEAVFSQKEELDARKTMKKMIKRHKQFDEILKKVTI